jgi:hypothetical protein
MGREKFRWILRNGGAKRIYLVQDRVQLGGGGSLKMVKNNYVPQRQKIVD